LGMIIFPCNYQEGEQVLMKNLIATVSYIALTPCILESNKTETDSLPLSTRAQHLSFAYHHVQPLLSARCSEANFEKSCGSMTFSFAKQCSTLATDSLGASPMVDKSWIRHWCIDLNSILTLEC
jgi:hypothetical protein